MLCTKKTYLLKIQCVIVQAVKKCYGIWFLHSTAQWREEGSGSNSVVSSGSSSLVIYVAMCIVVV